MKRIAGGKVYAEAPDGYCFAVLPSDKSGCHAVSKPCVMWGIDVGTVWHTYWIGVKAAQKALNL